MKMDVNKMMKQVQKMQADMAKAQEELAAEVVEASAGGGMVTVVVSGDKRLHAVTLDPEVVSREDVEMLQDLIVVAVNDAHRKVDDELSRQMIGLMGGLNIPGLS